MHRFINADTVIAGVSSDVNGYNLFAYCNNDPVNQMDTTGAWPQLTNKQKVAVGLAVIGVAAVLTVATAGLGGPVACFALGAIEGSITGAVTGAASGAAINGGIAFITSGGDLQKTKQAAIDGACDGFMSGSITGFITGGMTSNHCFVAGTVVITVAGKKAIEYIREGDLVLSEDLETGDVTYKKVLETYINEATELIHLNIDGEEIVTTPAHPFYVKNIGFVLAGDLEERTTLVDNEGNELRLLIKRWEQLQDAVLVYNFAVEDYHTYFVGSANVLVHNNCGTEQLGIETTKPCSASVHDHHIFPRQFKEFFSNAGINIDEYTVTLGEKLHLSGIHGSGNWNPRWAEFIANNPNATMKEIFQFGGSLMDEYGLGKYVIHAFHK